MGGTNSKPASATAAVIAASIKKEDKSASKATNRRPVFQGDSKEAIFFLNTTTLSLDLLLLIVSYWDFKFDFDEEKTVALTPVIYKAPGWFFLNKDPLPEKAADYLVWGNPEKVEAIIKNHPYILLVDTKATDHSRTFQGKLYEIALLIKDVLIKDEQGRTMAGMIESYLRNNFGEEEVEKQKTRVCPIIEEEEKESFAKRVADHNALHTVYLKLDVSNARDEKALAKDAEMIKAIDDYEKHLRTVGDWMMLANGEELFAEQYQHLGGFTSYKNNFCANRILGLIQFHRMRAWELQLLYSSVVYKKYKDRTDPSTVVPRRDVRVSFGFYPGAKLRLGVHFSIDIFGRRAPCRIQGPSGSEFLEDFFQAKHRACRNYIWTMSASREHLSGVVVRN